MSWRFSGPRVQLLLRFGYAGDRFHGLQPQPDVPTAGGALRQRLLDAGIKVKCLVFAARTDKGVHAIRAVATCFFRRPPQLSWQTFARQRAVFERPRDDGLRHVRAIQVPRNVHARGNASGKHYRYVIRDGLGGEIFRPRDHASYWPVSIPLNIDKMHEAGQALVGHHDFSAFRSPRCQAPDAQRELHRVEVTRSASGAVVIDIRGKSFVRQMVRIIVGSLGLVGGGLMTVQRLAEILRLKDRMQAGPIAPAGGLTLVEVLGDFGEPPALTSERAFIESADELVDGRLGAGA